jgi:hypothetical protein
MARQARKTAAQVAQKWSQNLTASTQSITNGVNAVTVAPTQLAAANVQGYIQGVQAAVASGKWQRNLNKVSLQDWKTAMTQKGISHIQTGATQAQPKVQQVFGPLLDFIYNTRDQINSSHPRGTLAANLARANAFATAMSQYNSGQ